jgi:hypothetical protein
MPRRLDLLLRFGGISPVQILLVVAFMLFLSASAPAQTWGDTLPPPCDDSNYGNCPKLQDGHSSPTKLDGAISYSFASDASLLASLGSQQAVDDFKSRARAAAQDWATKSGVRLSEAASGQAGNVTISVSGDPNTRASDGIVDFDPANNSRRTLTISDEYNGWSAEGKDSLFEHEFGHIIGIDDVGADECPGVNTVMRQSGSDAELVNGNSGAQPALNRPTRASNCDLDKGRKEYNQGVNTITPLSGGGGPNDGTGGGGYYYYPCTPYYWVEYWSWDGGETWELMDVSYAGCW